MKVEDLFIVFAVLLVLVGATYFIVMVLPAPAAAVPVTTPATQQQSYQSAYQEAYNQMQVQQLTSQLNTLQTKPAAQEPSVYYTDRYMDNYDSSTSSRYELRVRVRDIDNDDPVEDAKVRVQNSDEKTRYTDEDGLVTFTNLRDDCYDITVTHDDYRTETDSVCLDNDERVTIEVERE